MSSGELPLVIAHSKQIIKWPVWRAFPRDDKLAHVEALHREVHQRVLLGVVAPEPLQIDYQDGWDVVHLYFLDSLLVIDAAVAVPCVSLR